MRILRIQDLGNDLGHVLFVHGFQVLSLGKQLHVDGNRRRGAPQAQRIDYVAVVACNQHIAGNADDRGVILVQNAQVSVGIPVFFQRTAKVDFLGLVLLCYQPDIAHAQPVVGQLLLAAIDKLLLEDPVLIADGHAVPGQALRRHGVEIARSKPPQAAVAQASIGLYFVEIRQLYTEHGQRPFERFFQMQIKSIVVKRRSR